VWLRCKRAFLIFLILASVLTIFSTAIRGVFAQDGSAWLVADAPALSKTVELPANTTPDAYTINCTKVQHIAIGQATPQTLCTYPSPLGRLTTDGQIQTGTDTFVPLSGPSRQSIFIPSPNPSLTIVSLSAPTTGNQIGIYHNLTKADMQLVFTDGQGTYYQVAKMPDTIIRDPNTNQPLQVNTNDAVFSANGEWMVANVPQGGLVRVNMEDLSVKLFAAPIEPVWFLGIAGPPLAISDDGRYVAANTDIWGSGNLKLYDLSTCDSQMDVLPTKAVYCAGRNIWQGLTLTDQPAGKGIVDLWPGIQHPSGLEFNNDDTLSFTAWYDATSNSVYKIARFTVTAPGEAQHRLGLLGMGDSYISGQGTFVYTPESDNGNDTCHVSPLSYPFLLGKSYFNSYSSIACSGATTDKLSGRDKDGFQGQVNDKVIEKKRDKPNILANFLPGYIYQQEFASTYLPEAILLSVGGDDIGFADIVKSCVANSGGGTCFDTYEDRAELVQRINATYSKLVDTYTTIRDQSGGARIYVIGYPQVAKVGGDCGLNVHLNSDEVLFASQLIDYLDTIVQKAAQAAGVFYVDAQHVLDGHRLCESGDKAVNGFTVGNDAGITIPILNHEVNFIGSESYHPTQLGYQLLAQAIAAKTNNLTAPMPIPLAFSTPKFDSSVPLLMGAPVTGRPTYAMAYDPTISSDAVLAGDSERVVVGGTAIALQPHSTYRVVLHSDPVLLDEGGVDADGNISTTVHVPANTEPGYHTLHVYATTMAGEPVDIQKLMYIASTSNGIHACGAIPLSDQDTDQDGIDDACDPIIESPKAALAGNVATDVNTAKASSQDIQSQLVGSAKSPKTAMPTKILGAAIAKPQFPAKGLYAETENTAKERLFRLSWTQVALTALPLTAVGTALSVCLNRSQR